MEADPGQPVQSFGGGFPSAKERYCHLLANWSTSDVTGSPADFQRYIQSSRDEFSCAKPAYVRMLTSWISDHTLCYLASGRPPIIQDTSPTRYCSGHGVDLHFRDLEGAGECFEVTESDYQHTAPPHAHCRATLFRPRGQPRPFSRPLQHAKEQISLHSEGSA
jgi:hypothetical protein